MDWQTTISSKLNEQIQKQSYRTRLPNLNGNQRILTYQNHSYLNFASNDYLGLSHHPAIIHAWQEGAARYGVGSGGSGHVTGYSQIHQHLEESLADWLDYPRALLFNSGFSANQAAILSFISSEDYIISDKLAHASILESAMLSQCHLRRFHHNSIESLQKLLAMPQSGIKPIKKLVITEGVFSMDGDTAPLSNISKLCKKQNSWLMVDDAHGIGVYGEQGKGSCHKANIKPDLLIITFGKGFGLSGAAILCQNDTAEYLLQSARHLIYSTAMPISQAYALSESLHQIEKGEELREKLQQNIYYFHHLAKNLPISSSQTAIQPLIIGNNEKAMQAMNDLRSDGIWLTAIRPPTVPPNSARLRITLSAFHTQSDINKLVESLKKNINTSQL